MKFATDIDCLITEALERIATNTRTAVVALDAIYTDCKEEYYLWDFIEPAAKMRPLTTSTHIDMHIDIAQTRVK